MSNIDIAPRFLRRCDTCDETLQQFRARIPRVDPSPPPVPITPIDLPPCHVVTSPPCMFSLERDDATGRERAAPTTVTTGPPTAAIAAGKALTPLPAIWYVSSDERLRKRGGAIMPRKRRVRKVGDGEPLRVDGYGRVSTEEQEKEGVSLVNQEQRIRDYCKLYGLNLVRMVTDPGVSAKTLDREGVQSVLDDLRRGHVAGLVITKLDRLTRSLGDWSSLIDEFFSKDAGLRLFSVNDSIDTGTASGLLVLDVLMSVAQWERRIIAERTSDALQGKIRRGERCGRIRFGYTLGTDGKTLIPHEGEQKAISFMRSGASRERPTAT